MKYRYYYQTKTNENREGEIIARDRADAYAQLRKQGVRPYRLVGDDPRPWRRHLVPALAALALAAAAALVAVHFFAAAAEAPAARGQLVGDAAFIGRGIAGGWAKTFLNPLDDRLAQYAIPGRDVFALPPTTNELAAWSARLDERVELAVPERDELVQLRRIVCRLHAELAAHVAAGGTVADFLRALEEQQLEEANLRSRAFAALEGAPESMRHRVRLNLNLRLKAMGIEPLPE